MTHLYCPYCGDPLEIADEEVTCRRERMGLSRVVQDELTQIVESTIRWGGRWHCPADGEQMVELNGMVICPTCRRCLPGRTLYGLIEFHPHAEA